jgi:predicted double-glycine peptidase
MQHWELSCGAAALATILTWQQGDPVTEQEVVAGLLKLTTVARVNERHGFSLLDLKRFAEARGYLAFGYGEVTMDDLVRLGPAIVPIRVPGGQHFVVFRGIQDGWVLIGDPALGTRLMPTGAFEDVWADRDAFVLRRANGTKASDELTARSTDFAPATLKGGEGSRGGSGPP